MKFGKQIQSEVVSEWRDQYVSYKRLKRILKKLDIHVDEHKKSRAESTMNETQVSIDEHTPLVHSITSTERFQKHKKEFDDALKDDIMKVNHFFFEKLKEYQLMLKDWHTVYRELAISLTDESERESIQGGFRYEQLLTGHSEAAKTAASRLLLLYQEVDKLHKYRELNFTGLRKIVKKFDKTTGLETQDVFMAGLLQERFYCDEKLQHLMDEIADLYSKVSATHRPIKEALELLKLTSPQKEETVKVYKPQFLALAFIAAFICWLTPIFDEDRERAQTCVVLLVFVLTLWVTEALPFFVSAMCIPPLVVLGNIIADDDGVPLDAEGAAKFIFSKVFDHTLALVLGGFSISAAFSKYEFELVLASWIQRSCGKKPYLFLLAFMALSFFLSMWISNVAAPVLCTAIILPIIRDFPLSCKFTKALLIGLAFSCNIGGMLSPISSPQNAFMIGYLSGEYPEYSISFAQWITFSVPFCVLGLIVLWVYLIVALKPDDVNEIPAIVWEKKPMSFNHYFVLFVTFLTAALWCTLSLTKDVVGDLGIIAYLPIILFFGTGILTKAEFNNFQWNLLMLIGGGSCLGAAVSSSNLLQIVVSQVTPGLQGNSLWVTFAVVCLFVGIVTTFISHTVAALILVPVVGQVAMELDGSPVQILVSGCAVMCSAAMALPMSSFPNINSLFIEDDFERTYLSVSDYIQHGTTFTIILYLLNISWGFLLLYFQFPLGE